MGEAISDAASWYEKSEWMGLCSTPMTNNILEHYLDYERLNNAFFMIPYPVPLKNGQKFELYTVSWAGRFFHNNTSLSDGRKYFLKLLKDQPVPLGTELKYKNTKDYFGCVSEIIANLKSQQKQIKGPEEQE